MGMIGNCGYRWEVAGYLSQSYVSDETSSYLFCVEPCSLKIMNLICEYPYWAYKQTSGAVGVQHRGRCCMTVVCIDRVVTEVASNQ